MTVKQISVFVENKAGRLAEITRVLYDNNIDLRALSIAETRDFGVLRLIVDDTYKTACILKEAGYVFSITPVLAVAVSDEPGSLCRILQVLSDSGISLEYTYAFTASRQGLAYMVFRVENHEKAIEVLSKSGIPLICQEQFDSL